MTLITDTVKMKKYYANVAVGETAASSKSEDWCVLAMDEKHARSKIEQIAARWNKWIRIIFIGVEN